MAGCVRILIHYTSWFALLTWCSNKQTKQDVIAKTAPDFLFPNERDILDRFQTIISLRRLIDEVQDPPLLVLEYLDNNLLTESARKKTPVFRS